MKQIELPGDKVFFHLCGLGACALRMDSSMSVTGSLWGLDPARAASLHILSQHFPYLTLPPFTALWPCQVLAQGLQLAFCLESPLLNTHEASYSHKAPSLILSNTPGPLFSLLDNLSLPNTEFHI